MMLELSAGYRPVDITSHLRRTIGLQNCELAILVGSPRAETLVEVEQNSGEVGA